MAEHPADGFTGVKTFVFCAKSFSKNNTKIFRNYLAVSKISRTFAPLSKMVGCLQAGYTECIRPTDIAGKSDTECARGKGARVLCDNVTVYMATFSMEVPFREFRGKICRHSQIIYKKMYGKQFTTAICNPSQDAPTEAQTAQRNKMRTAVANLKKLSSAEMAAYQTAFKAQRSYKTLRGYMIAQEMQKLS